MDMSLFRWLLSTVWREASMLARMVLTIGIGGPAALSLNLSPFFQRTNWHRIGDALENADKALPWTGWLTVSLVFALIWLVIVIAKRAKAMEDNRRRDALDKTNALTLHDFLQYVGITVGDVSDKGRKIAENALERLEMLASAGEVRIWGILNKQAFHGRYQPIPKKHWGVAFIYSGNATEDRPENTNYVLGVSTTPRDANLAHGPTENGIDLFDHLYISKTDIKREFRKNEYKSNHKASFRCFV
ncbi:MAG: hypothetical protein WD470_02875 [Rhodospirillaceae bacterium]